MHKGTITVTSESGKGSTFTFTLPFYTSRVALEDSVEEIVDYAQRIHENAVSLIALDAEPVMEALSESASFSLQPRSAQVEAIGAYLSRHVYSGDVVLSLEPRWVVILAITDARGAHAIIDRLRGALHAWLTERGATALSAPIHFGVALYPADGPDAQALFAKATSLIPQYSQRAVTMKKMAV